MGAGGVRELGAAVAGHVVTNEVAVTVLMTVRDTPVAMLEQAIGSILGQTFADFEFLILDDGSRNRETIASLERCASTDARIRFERSLVEGLPKTANIGLARARGEFVARQDSDDWSEPGRLEAQMRFLWEHPDVGMCGSAAWMHRRDGAALWRKRMPLSSEEIRSAFWSANPFVHGSTMFRRELALQAGGYCEEFSCSLDYDFLWRLSELSGAANLAEPLYHYRYWGGAVSARRAADQARGKRAAQILAEARRRGETEDAVAALACPASDRDQMSAALRQADHLLLAGEYTGAFRAYASLAWSHPASALAWAKLLRGGVFAGVPLVRQACFR
jgi:glycosyltransferase involved in cell wall biosynthesis